jgi:hypothetical protein
VYSTELGFMEEWPEKKALLKEKNKQTRLVFAKCMWETPQMYGRRYSGQMRLKCSFLAIKENVMSVANPTPLITVRTVFHRQRLGNWLELKG